MPDITLRAFSGVTGAATRRLPFLDVNWRDSINEAGSMDVELPADIDARTLCAPWKTILAAFYDDRILHAGYVTHLRRNHADGKWNVDVGGGFTIFEKRLVLVPALANGWKNGRVKVDEEHPSGSWNYAIKGSYSDIVSFLISDSVNTWGRLPMQTIARQGGSHERNYNSYDFATVWDRIRDITELEDGPEVRLDPTMSGNSIYFRQRTADEIIDHRWKWNATIPGSPVTVDDTDIEGEDLCTQSYGSGGRDKDMLLVARSVGTALTNAGYPVLQVANTGHSSVDKLETLQSYVNGDVNAGRRMGLTRSLTCDLSLDVRCGDWADVRTSDGLLQLKITDVSGGISKGCLTLQATDRY